MRAHETRAVGIAHRPDAPRALASMRTLSGEDELLDATIDEIRDEHRRTPPDVSSPTTGASRAEVHHAALLHVDPGLVAVATHLLRNSVSRPGGESSHGLTVDTRAACIALYVDARTDACVDATNRDGLARLRAETEKTAKNTPATRLPDTNADDADDRGGLRSTHRSTATTHRSHILAMTDSYWPACNSDDKLLQVGLGWIDSSERTM